MFKPGEIKPGMLVKIISGGFTFDVSGGMIRDDAGIGIVISVDTENKEIRSLDIFFSSSGLCKKIPSTIVQLIE